MDRGDPFVVQNARSTIKGSSFDGQLCVASIADRRTVGIDGTGKVSVLDRHRPIIVNGTITALFGDGRIDAAVAGDDHRSLVDQRSSGKVHIVHKDAVSVQIQDHALSLWQCRDRIDQKILRQLNGRRLMFRCCVKRFLQIGRSPIADVQDVLLCRGDRHGPIHRCKQQHGQKQRKYFFHQI